MSDIKLPKKYLKDCGERCYFSLEEWLLDNISDNKAEIQTTLSIISVAASIFPIAFAAPTIYGTFSSPLNATTYSQDLTGGKIGIVQKIYLTGALIVPSNWVKIGGLTYDAAEINIVYLEYTSASRLEYWISRDE
jgi:hypothetical protein